MKICWDNIENIRLSKNGNFRDTVKNKTYYLLECKQCKGEFLNIKKNGIFCCKKCSTSYRWKDKNSKFNSNNTKLKISNSVKKLWNDPNYKDNCSDKIKKLWNNPDSKYNSKNVRQKYSERNKNQWKDPDSKFNSLEYRRNLSDKIRLNRSNPNSKYNTNEYREKISKKNKNKGNRNWKGGYDKKGVPFYDTYAHQIEWCEEVRRNEQDPNVLEVKCFKCDKWYIPNITNLRNKIQSTKGNYVGENNLYCSDECKHSCSIYGKNAETLMKEDAIRAGRLPWIELTREVQPELRQMVLDRDNNECVKCGETENIQCHHIYPVNIEPLLSADIDNCVTLCVECHKEVHKKDGCNYSQLHMEEC